MNPELPPTGEEGAAAPDEQPTIERLERTFAEETARAKANLEGSGILLRTPARPSRRKVPALPLGIGALTVVLVVVAVVLRGGSQLGNGGISPIDSGSGVTASPQVPPATPLTSALSTLAGQTASPVGTLVESSDWNAITWSRTGATPWRGAGNVFVQDAISWGSGFVAVGYEAGVRPHGVVWLTSDGQTWQREPDPTGVFDGARLSSVAVSGDTLVAFGDTGADPGNGPSVVWTSDDGATWTGAPDATQAFTGQPIQGITAGPGGFLAYTEDQAQSVLRTWVSSDGRAWAAGQALPSIGRGTVVGTPRGYFASAAGVEWLSSDGRAWTEANGSNSDRLFGFIPGADGVVAVVEPVSTCPGGEVCLGPIIFPTYRQSSDGINWVDLNGVGPFAGGDSDTLGGRMASDGNTIVWIAPSGRIWASLDGLAWHELRSFVVDQASLQAVGDLNFGFIAVGRQSLVSIDHDSGIPVIWLGAVSAQASQGPQPTFPLRYNDGRTDRQCIGGEGGDPGVVCIQIGYYLRNDSGSDQLVRMQGAVNSVVRVAAGQTGYLTEIGPVWDSGLRLRVQLLSEQCDVIDGITATGNLELFTIHAGVSNPLTGTINLPAEALPETPFPTATICGG